MPNAAAPSEYLDLDEAFVELQLHHAIDAAAEHSLADAPRPSGPAIYVLRYRGRKFPLYLPLAATGWPIYIGATTSPGRCRLVEHRLSISRAVNLDLDDIVVNLVEAPSAAAARFYEDLAIGHFRPLWCEILTGFGQKSSLGRSRQAAQRATKWDSVHPGRRFVSRNRPWDLDMLLQDVRHHLEATVPLA